MIRFRDAVTHLLAELAYRCGGRAFGGYVRDHVIRGAAWGDLDVWFRDTVSADRYAYWLSRQPDLHISYEDGKGGNLSIGGRHAPRPSMGTYTDRMVLDVKPNPRVENTMVDVREMIFAAQITVRLPLHDIPVGLCVALPLNLARYVASAYVEDHVVTYQAGDASDDRDYSWIDVVVAPDLPVNDFDVNRVSYDGHVITSYGGPDLIQRIRDGQAQMLPGYLLRCLTLRHDQLWDYPVRRTEKLKDKGFRVLAPPKHREEISQLPRYRLNSLDLSYFDRE